MYCDVLRMHSASFRNTCIADVFGMYFVCIWIVLCAHTRMHSKYIQIHVEYMYFTPCLAIHRNTWQYIAIHVFGGIQTKYIGIHTRFEIHVFGGIQTKYIGIHPNTLIENPPNLNRKPPRFPGATCAIPDSFCHNKE